MVSKIEGENLEKNKSPNIGKLAPDLIGQSNRGMDGKRKGG